MLGFVIVAVVVLLPVVFVIATYNTLIGLKNAIRDSWSDIDTELKRRYDLIPNLVAAVNGYVTHEKAVLEQVTQLRNQCQANHGPVKDQCVDEKQLVAALQRLLVVVENYPTLKADQHFLALQRELVNTEDRIQAARRFYNGNVRDFQNKCQTFPSLIVASMFGFEACDFFDVEPAVRQTPSVQMP